MSFSVFRNQYYEERLSYYEGLDLSRLSEATLLDAAGEASSLHKFLTDIIEEGYAAAVNRLVAQTDAINRLQRFLAAALPQLGALSERERFYLFPEPMAPAQLASSSFEAGETFELHAYLEHLDQGSDRAVDIAHCFDTAQQMQRWQARTQTLMGEMAAFLIWICGELARREAATPVPLLRDALLIHLGLTWLRRAGLKAPAPQPVMIGRHFADTCGDGRAIHAALSDVIYRVLLESPGCDLARLRRQFALYAHEAPEIPASFLQACRDYLQELDLQGPPLLIESGVQGSFTLLLLGLNGDVGDMVFYTTTPWLYPIYAPIVFQKNYNYLREMETIVAHDYLFQFREKRDTRIDVNETVNEKVKNLALYEVHVFKEMVHRRMHKVI